MNPRYPGNPVPRVNDIIIGKMLGCVRPGVVLKEFTIDGGAYLLAAALTLSTRVRPRLALPPAWLDGDVLPTYGGKGLREDASVSCALLVVYRDHVCSTGQRLTPYAGVRVRDFLQPYLTL